MEFLVTSRTAIPDSLPADERRGLRDAERARAIELSDAGVLRRIWRIPGTRAAIHLYEVADATELHDVLSSLPHFPWMDIDVQPLALHPVELALLQQSRG